jgi:hypothetical protein
MDNDSDSFDFQRELTDILKLPGVRQNTVAEWAEVDPSTVTRWLQGKTPSDPVQIFKRLRPHADRAREALAEVRSTEVDSWRSLYSDLDPGIRDYVDNTGLLAGLYYAILCWVPSSASDHESDVVALRYFDAVWADMGRRLYNIGDSSQILAQPDGERIGFSQERALTDITDVWIDADEKVVGRSFGQLRVQLNLEGFPYHRSSIGFVGGFGYRFRARKAILAKRNADQTNDFLGAPIVLPCRRLNLFVCIPGSCLRGSPSAMSYSNRGAMLKILTRLDDADLPSLESLLWPRGHQYAMSNAPDSPLKHLQRVGATIESMPHALQEALNEPADLERPKDESIRDVLCRLDSACYLLDIPFPHPSLTNTITWRLAD